MMTVSKVWVVGKKPVGVPKETDFKCIEEQVAPLCDGGIIIEAKFLSVDPYMRYRIENSEIGSVITGSQVAEVVESKNPEYPVGCHVVANPGWRTSTNISKEIFDSYDKDPTAFRPVKLPDFGGIPLSYALGIFGMPGNTAYFGFLEICNPKEGETVVVNSAGGAVGSLVCQIAKIKGCRVVGFAGTDEKVAWLIDNGCVNVAFNYKKVNVFDVLKTAAPNGVDCYFDNVGGTFSAQVWPHLNLYGRISVCGCISKYNETSEDRETLSLSSPFTEPSIIMKQLKVEGFIVMRWLHRWLEGIEQMKQWFIQGKLKYRETVIQGFESMPKAFIGLFSGDNVGKMIVSA